MTWFSRHGGVGLLVFSSLNDSMILRFCLSPMVSAELPFAPFCCVLSRGTWRLVLTM